MIAKNSNVASIVFWMLLVFNGASAEERSFSIDGIVRGLSVDQARLVFPDLAPNGLTINVNGGPRILKVYKIPSDLNLSVVAIDDKVDSIFGSRLEVRFQHDRLVFNRGEKLLELIAHLGPPATSDLTTARWYFVDASTTLEVRLEDQEIVRFSLSELDNKYRKIPISRSE